ncbi:hypothetical protein WJX77_006525 [Trebouxia sp. C0004]
MNTFRQLLQLQGQLQFCPAEGHCQAEAEVQAQARGESGVADQFIAYINKDTPLDETTMRLAARPGAPSERLWNLVKQEASQLSKLAIRLMGVSVNAAGFDGTETGPGKSHEGDGYT